MRTHLLRGSLGLFLLAARPAVAQAPYLWSGDFTDAGNFTQYIDVLCGAYAGPASCPGGVQGNVLMTSASGFSCPNPNQGDCRLLLVDPTTDGGPGQTPAGNRVALRVTNEHIPDAGEGNPDGDSDPLGGNPWGNDFHDMIGNANDHSQAMETNGSTPPGYYTEGDERWFGFSVYVPSGSFPNPIVPRRDSPDAGQAPNQNWHVIFQLHSVGECDEGGPNFSLNINRTDDSQTGPEHGMYYMFTLSKRDTYSPCEGNPTSGAAFWPTDAGAGSNGDYRLWPPFDPNNVTTTPAAEQVVKDAWHTFVMHVRFSQYSNIGFLSLMMDGIPLYPLVGQPVSRPTLYSWPSSNQCSQLAYVGTPQCPTSNGGVDDPTWFPDAGGGPMPSYLVTGNYRSRWIIPTESIFIADLKDTQLESQCPNVDPSGGLNCGCIPNGSSQPCANNDACCSGRCDADGGCVTCEAPSQPCNLTSDCCEGDHNYPNRCVDGGAGAVCQIPSRSSESCTSVATVASECVGNCVQAFCCSPLGGGCAQDYECCTGACSDGGCAAPCAVAGDLCGGPSDCCSGETCSTSGACCSLGGQLCSDPTSCAVDCCSGGSRSYSACPPSFPACGVTVDACTCSPADHSCIQDSDCCSNSPPMACSPNFYFNNASVCCVISGGAPGGTGCYDNSSCCSGVCSMSGEVGTCT